jgi:hypothetical protein
MSGRSGWSWEVARGWTLRALVGSAAIVGACALLGCGSGSGTQAASVARIEPPAQAVATPAVALKPAVVPETTQRESTDPGSMPPEVDVAVVDTLVAPGQAVELVAHGTPDVDRIALKDGNGDTLPFVKDADGKAWRVTYRMPLKPRYERAGLSVTAHTEAHRWRRVWVFVHVQGADAVPEEVPGSAAGR